MCLARGVAVDGLAIQWEGQQQSQTDIDVG
jgi:hypothetical protein